MRTQLAEAGNEMRAVLRALEALNAGDESVRLPEDWTGTVGAIAKIINQIALHGAPAGQSAERRAGNGQRAPRPAPDALLNNDQSVAVLGALLAVKKGDASIRLPLDWPGVAGKIADAFNDVVELNCAQRSRSWRA